jgi:hypothetical protein
MRAFKPKQNFEWLNEKGEPIGHYVEGLVYVINNESSPLAKMAEQWAKEGKIQLADSEAELGAKESRARGTATVT